MTVAAAFVSSAFRPRLGKALPLDGGGLGGGGPGIDVADSRIREDGLG
jgi:hypothetical protein